MRIWKFTLTIEDEQTIEMPVGAQLLSVANQSEEVVLWALCDPSASKVNRHFALRGTGHPAEGLGGPMAPFVGTVLLRNGSLVFHVFDRGVSKVAS